MTTPAVPGRDLTVAVLCAAWCHVCNDYRAPFERMQPRFAPARFRWIDIEDEADLVGDIDVENFPTVLVADGPTPLFFGTLSPQPEVLERLVHACMSDAGPSPVNDAEVAALAARLAQHH